MESLYRKYRPLTFDSVVGQQHIVSTLEHAITEGRLSHAYLFCGPRGTGKTTMARILAKALLCRNAEAARAEGASGCMPDGTCEECELIAEGNHPDVYELDAASRSPRIWSETSPKSERASSACTEPLPKTLSCSSVDNASRMPPLAWRATMASASSS